MRILNIPDAVMVPGQPECPVFTLTQRVAITLLRLSTSLPILVSQEILPIGVSTKDNGPVSSMMTTIIIIIIIIVIIIVFFLSITWFRFECLFNDLFTSSGSLKIYGERNGQALRQ